MRHAPDKLALYQLFHRAINALPDPDAYCVSRWRISMHGHRRPYVTTLKSPPRLSLPWEELDGVLSAVWYPPRGSAPLPDFPKLPRVRIFPCYRDNGIGMRTDYDPRELHIFGVSGVIRPNRPNFDPANLMLPERHELTSEWEVIETIGRHLRCAYHVVHQQTSVVANPT